MYKNVSIKLPTCICDVTLNNRCLFQVRPVVIRTGKWSRWPLICCDHFRYSQKCLNGFRFTLIVSVFRVCTVIESYFICTPAPVSVTVAAKVTVTVTAVKGNVPQSIYMKIYCNMQSILLLILKFQRIYCVFYFYYF